MNEPTIKTLPELYCQAKEQDIIQASERLDEKWLLVDDEIKWLKSQIVNIKHILTKDSEDEFIIEDLLELKKGFEKRLSQLKGERARVRG